jgi:hypothetical protein
VDLSDFCAVVLSEVYGYSTPLTNSLINKQCLFYMPLLIFQPTVNCSASDKDVT